MEINVTHGGNIMKVNHDSANHVSIHETSEIILGLSALLAEGLTEFFTKMFLSVSQTRKFSTEMLNITICKHEMTLGQIINVERAELSSKVTFRLKSIANLRSSLYQDVLTQTQAKGS